MLPQITMYSFHHPHDCDGISFCLYPFHVVYVCNGALLLILLLRRFYLRSIGVFARKFGTNITIFITVVCGVAVYCTLLLLVFVLRLLCLSLSFVLFLSFWIAYHPSLNLIAFSPRHGEYGRLGYSSKKTKKERESKRYSIRLN